MTVLGFLHDFGFLFAALLVLLVLILWAGVREANNPGPRDDREGFEANEETRGADELPVKPAARPTSQSQSRPKDPPPRNRRAP